MNAKSVSAIGLPPSRGEGSPPSWPRSSASTRCFIRPFVHTQQRRRELVIAYLAATGQTLGNASFRYVCELVDGENAVLEFKTKLGGIHVNGVDPIRYDADGMIADFKVMVRSLRTVNKVWEVMAAQHQRAKAH